jgi:histidinol-phosphatase (PHP family)
VTSASIPWTVSLHGGHSGDFCAHGRDTLREMLEAACDAGYQVFGVSNHAPPIDDNFLYDDEITAGLDAAALDRRFDEYFRSLDALATEFAGRLTVLRGFEAESVPGDGFAPYMLGLRSRHPFDYMVGSVHYVDDVPIDVDAELYAKAAAHQGGEEALVVRYYETVAGMVAGLQPEVVGHLDVIRKYIGGQDALTTPASVTAAAAALDAVQEAGSILDLNPSNIRRNGEPYPAPWLVQLAKQRGIPFCFGDDSHSVDMVGNGIVEARDYLLGLGVEEITVLEPASKGVGRRRISLA